MSNFAVDLLDAITWRVKAMLMRLFARKEREAIQQAPTLLLPAPPPAAPERLIEDDLPAAAVTEEAAPKPPRPRRKRTQEPANHQTFAELLENLDASFETMRVPEFAGSWLGRREVRAIHKMGVFVAQDFAMELMDDPKIPVGIPLPTIASCFMIHKKHETGDRIAPRFAFAIKQPSLPPGVEQVRGVAYQFGECYELTAGRQVGEKPRTFWIWSWVVVKQDGSIVFPKERQKVVHHINHRRRSAGATTRSSTFSSQAWRSPALIEMRDCEKQTQEETERFLGSMFRQLITWWVARESQWSVGVRKDGRRVTFSIRPEQTAAYFADRNHVVNEGGKNKKIIHFVRAHQRANGAVVKSHVRGLREFQWRGYRCAVTAPRLTGNVLTAAFDLPPVEVEADAVHPEMLEIDQVAARVADWEDVDRRHAA